MPLEITSWAALWFLPFAFTMLLGWRLLQPLLMRISPMRIPRSKSMW